MEFHDCFKCDPSHPTFGYSSWDGRTFPSFLAIVSKANVLVAFFTRELADGYRETASPDDDSVIANACESKSAYVLFVFFKLIALTFVIYRPFNLQHNVKLVDEFWTKGNKYSFSDMMAGSELAPQFEGGTVYQAFLSALSYHRWHTPVSGTIKKAFVADGTYFSEKISSAIFNTNDAAASKSGLTNSQSYIAHLATRCVNGYKLARSHQLTIACRAIIFIEADNPDIGLMCFVGIGMDEVSTCEITVKEGEHVTKGQCTGMFHFGGSSVSLLPSRLFLTTVAQSSLLTSSPIIPSHL